MYTEKSGRFGINIRKYCAEHDAFVAERLAADGGTEELLRLHRLKIAWLQHERLVHLIVLLITALLFLFFIILFIILMDRLVLFPAAAALALLIAYIRHYFFLENTVQTWYVLYDRISEKLR